MPTSPNDTYTSPLASRNASPEMLGLWSPRHKFTLWRRVWLAVAQAQQEVTRDRAEGPLVTGAQVGELRAAVERGISDEEISRASTLERELRHDVMSHVHALGEVCPGAKPIVHLGCTSQDVVCNAELLILREACGLVHMKALRCVDAFARQAERWKALPTLGFTHYQPAQPTTVGRRAAGWGHDVLIAAEAVSLARGRVRLRGLRGATGTQASFLHLLGGDEAAVDRLEAAFVRHLDGDGAEGRPQDGATYALTGQTYPRVVDAELLSALASAASVLHKVATDLRLLSNRKEIDEPFGASQIGSSAMPYKRNPMMCERICGLARFVINLVGNAYDTAATQWLERTLDDSSNRRLSLPEAFCALDGALDLLHRVASGMVVHEAMVRKNLMAELPFMATENILMEAVRAGGDRQDLHERIRVHAQDAGHRVKHEGLDNDLIERLRGDAAFAGVRDRITEEHLLDPSAYVGRAVEQTERFIAEAVTPVRERHSEALTRLGSGDRGV